MSNAVKFTPEKGRITIQTILKDKQLVQQRMTMSEDEGAGNAVVPGGHRNYQKNHTNSLRESSFSNDKNSLHVQMRQYYIEFEIHIIDTGCGITKENIPKLFMNFSRLEEH
jgi:signal transduction histidine kinase